MRAQDVKIVQRKTGRQNKGQMDEQEKPPQKIEGK